MDTLENFVAAAHAYCNWCGSPPADEDREARIALSLLARLYSLAQELRWPDDFDADLDGDSLDYEAWRTVYDRAAALPFNYYSTVLDPLVVPSESPVVDDLADDIADVYRDLHEGLSLYIAGHVAEAQWEFVRSFQMHWGRHASSAVLALHRWFEAGDKW